MIEKDIEYLEEKFPKGKTKFRGEAMVLLAIAREQGKKELKKDFLKFLKWVKPRCNFSNLHYGEILEDKIKELEK